MDWSFVKKDLSQIKWVYYLPIFILILFIIFGTAFKFSNTVKIIKMLQQKIEVKRQGPVKAQGVYISSWTAGEKARVKKLTDFILNTRLNAAVIDIKDVTGRVSYITEVPLARENHLYELRIQNIKKLIKFLKDKGIYVIGRISVFKDNALASKKMRLALKDKQTNKVWKDSSSLSWVDPSSKQVWNYNIALAKEALSLGFEEINFDYIRFPSDGNIKDIKYPIWQGKRSKQQIIKSFFEHQFKELKDFRVSADLFGMTMSHVLDGFDMNIGQRLEDAYPFFDYICPMLYPSYFQGAYKDIKDPFQKPYQIINKSFQDASLFIKDKNNQNTFIRPWIQAFDTKEDKATPDFLKKQKQAVLDNNAYGFLLWSSKNDYFDFKKVLSVE